MRIVIGYKDGKKIFSENEPAAAAPDTRKPHYIRPINGPQRVTTKSDLRPEPR